MALTDYETTRKNRIRRLAKRASYERETIHRILDEAWVCHVGIVEQSEPVVIPMYYVRQEDSLLLHGAKSSRLLKTLISGEPICLSVTIIDGLVLAKSLFHHSLNYRSVVAYGVASEIVEPSQRERGFAAIANRIAPGRATDARPPNSMENEATALVAVQITSASAKVRTGGPMEDPADATLPVWAGVIPLSLAAGRAQRSHDLDKSIGFPSYLRMQFPSAVEPPTPDSDLGLDEAAAAAHVPVSFRTAVESDLPAIVRLLADDPLGNTREEGGLPIDQAYVHAYREIAKDPNQQLVIAELPNGQVVGTCQLSFLPSLTYRGTLRAQLEAVRVAKAWRKRGLGQQMVGYAEDLARSRNAGIMQLTSDMRRPDAIHFYESLGFVSSHAGMKKQL